ncbi:hypothetical protein CBM2599_A120392 [Cupriavidus taiwanensis]|nr:hypothetical protein CBM2599_A120392 [Cupriavidus taiwanensis]
MAPRVARRASCGPLLFYAHAARIRHPGARKCIAWHPPQVGLGDCANLSPPLKISISMN